MLKLLSVMTVFLFLGGLWYCGAASAAGFEEDVPDIRRRGDHHLSRPRNPDALFRRQGDPRSLAARSPTTRLFRKADAVLITHEHQDHLDTEALKHLVDGTDIVLNRKSAAALGKGRIIGNGENKESPRHNSGSRAGLQYRSQAGQRPAVPSEGRAQRLAFSPSATHGST